MSNLNYKFERSNDKITPFGGVSLLIPLLEKLGIREYLDKELDHPASNRGKPPSSKIIPVILSMICGGRSFSDIDKLSFDKVLSYISGIEDIPDSSSISRYFSKTESMLDEIAVNKTISKLGSLNYKIVKDALKREKPSSVTLDQDATYTEVYKRDAKYCYKKFKAYSSMMCFIGESGYCIDEEFREGNVNAQVGILDQLQRVHKYLASCGIEVSNVRNDSAGYQAKVLNYCFDNDLTFFIGGNLDSSVHNGINNIPSDSWKTYNNRHGDESDNEEISEFIHCMNETKESFRMIVVRKQIESENPTVPELLGDKYEYRVIATNSELDAEKVVHFYNLRGVCEYNIKEAKYGFNLKSFPSGNLSGNGLWFKTGILAYNLIMYLKRIIMGGAYKNKEMGSIRYQVISIAAKLVSHGGRKVLKLCCSVEMFKKMEYWRSVCLML